MISIGREARKVTGRVVGEDGGAVGGADLGSVWLWDIEKRGRYTGYAGVRAGADGRFSLPLLDAPLPQTVLALDPEQKRGAFLVVTEAVTAGGEVTIRLEPLARAAYAVEVPGWRGEPPALFPRVGPQGKPACVTLANRLSGEVPLPPGPCDLAISSTDLTPASAVLRPGGPATRIVMEAGIIPKNYGRPALPVRLTDAIGVGKGFRLEDLRGKWVLIEFWGHWCKPCVEKSLPELRDFYLANADRRDRFEFLAFHASDVATAAALRPYLARLERDVWQGKPLPFPVLLDGTGETIRRWGVAVYPQLVLLDPEGRYVRGASLDLLKQKLGLSTG